MTTEDKENVDERDYRCLACGKESGASGLIRRPYLHNGTMLMCGNAFCGGSVIVVGDVVRKEDDDAVWSVSDGGDFVVDQYGCEVCQFFDKFEDDFGNKDDNAILVAAAPELLKILSGIVDAFYDDSETSIAMAGNMATARRVVSNLRFADGENK